VIKLIWDTGFKRAYQKKIKQDEALKKRYWKILELFLENPYDQQLRTHKLTGKLKGFGPSVLLMIAALFSDL
jgi:proteic killer suppression protein